MTKSRPVQLRMITAVFAVAFAILAGVLGAAEPASAAVGQIDGTVVQDGTSTGIGAITVDLYDDTQPTPIATTTTSSTGVYSFAVAVPGDYSVRARSDDWVEGTDDIDAYDPALGFTVPPLELLPGVVLTGVVRNAQTGLGIPNIPILAFEVSGSSADPFDGSVALTDATGAYRVTVPLNGEYQLVAFPIDVNLGLLYWPQVWDHRSLFSFSCNCDQDTIVSPSAQGLPPTPVPGYDFDLWSVDNVLISVEAWDDTVPPGVEYPGLTSHLYKKSGSTWVEVDVRDTDGVGFADLYGPQGKSLRLRFSLGGVFVPVEYAKDDNGDPLSLGKNGCWVSLGALTNDASFSPFPVEVSLDTTRTACPATMPSTPGGSPAVPPASSPYPFPIGVGSTPLATPTPSATPTPTPTPTPSSEPTDQPVPVPSESATATPDPASASTDLWWVWLVIALLALGIVVTIVVMVRRR